MAKSSKPDSELGEIRISIPVIPAIPTAYHSVPLSASFRKSSAGFDLTKLFIGAEGTLGIVTEGTSIDCDFASNVLANT